MADWNDIRRRAQAPVTPPQNAGLPQAQSQVGLGQAAYREGMGAQRDVYRQLQDQAAGRGGASQAQLMAGQMGQQNLVNQVGMAAQARGGSLASQQRQVAGLGAASQMGMAQQAAQIRQAEQAQAMQALQAQANTMGGQGLQQMMGSNAALQGIYGQQYAGELQTALANQQAAAAQLEANRKLLMQGLSMGAGAIQNFAGGQAARGMIQGIGQAGGGF